MVAECRFHGGDSPLSVWRNRGREPAETIPAFRRVAYYKGWIHGACGRRRGLGVSHRTLAAFCRDACQRGRMGGHGRCRSQRNHCTMVRANATGGAILSLQWGEHWWRRLLTALGGRDRAVWISWGHSGDWPRNDCYSLDFGGCVLCQGARADGIDP